MRARIWTACIVVLSGAPNVAIAQSSLSFTETAYLSGEQLARIEVFLSRRSEDTYVVGGNVQFRNESSSPFCSQIAVAALDKAGEIVMYGTGAKGCVTPGSRSLPSLHLVRAEMSLKRVGPGELMRLVAVAIPGTADEVPLDSVMRASLKSAQRRIP